MKTIKLLIASISAIVLGFAATSVLLTATTHASTTADPKNNLCMGSNLTNNSSTCDAITKNAGNGVNNMVATIINIFSWIVGVVCVIMIIYGGFRYVTAGGDSGRVGDAKNTILYAIVGLVIVALAQVIVKFVLQKVTSA